ncbi:major histocompatibility complex class I-related gene protein-like isoform X2 [Hemicordylus capensis]|nr:major histocompatibility complex class I-related gene protein-like isoform X2 [Hemicordylus capensis]XP_053145481.1 major histocompatibility complex class I-related gene protein-like isoform X2 [Hemicordylus capensis]XP_053145482.1 major histocompatibility complex class I-related gene protein-like isoform X2 [Hemicordylus capensis]
MSEPIQGQPWFTQLGYVDDQIITRYDSSTRRDQPQVPWVEKEEDPWFWERETHHAREAEQFFRQALWTLKSRYNQSGGLHTWQCLVGCELSKDGKQKGRFMQCGYDGRDFISLDKETFSWLAADAKAQVTKRKWEDDPTIAGIWKRYLEEECIERLQKYLHYGNKTLLRTEPPMAQVTHKVDHDVLETLICRVDGFYPKDINATWKKDGEFWEHETFHGRVTPNSDGTYHTWLSIEIDPKDRDQYRCHVEHDGLLKPLHLAVEEPAPVPVEVMKPILGVLVGVFLLLSAIIVYIKKWNRNSCTHKASLSSCDLETGNFPMEDVQQDASRATQESALSAGPQKQEEGIFLSPLLGLSDHLSSNDEELQSSVNRRNVDKPAFP